MLRHSHQKKSVARGFTMIELLVVLAIAGLLIAILVPAVQSVRATAQRLRCQNQLRQLGLALHNYADTHTTLPAQESSAVSVCDRRSAIAALFPYLELRDKCRLMESGVNILPQLLCPADSVISDAITPTSYVPNASPGDWAGSKARGPFDHDTFRRGVRWSEITDGATNTAAFSERLFRWPDGDAATAERLPLRYHWYVAVPRFSSAPPPLLEQVNLAEASIQACRYGPRDFVPERPPLLAASWGGANGLRHYSHWFPPNTPQCVGPTYAFISSSAPASSDHRGGVNVAFLDGRVHFVSAEVDQRVWRAAGTHNGGEVEATAIVNP